MRLACPLSLSEETAEVRDIHSLCPGLSLLHQGGRKWGIIRTGMKGKGLGSTQGSKRLALLEKRSWEGKGRSAGNLLFFEVTFQKGRRREGVEDSWRANQGRAILMVMAGTVTGTVFMVIHKEVSHRSQLSRATPGPHATPGKDRAL